MKAHIGVDARTGMAHSFTTTAANQRDLNQAENLLHGDEGFIFADAGYRGAEKRDELKDIDVDWHIAVRPGKVRTLKKYPRINKALINIEYMKASVRAKVENRFGSSKASSGSPRLATEA